MKKTLLIGATALLTITNTGVPVAASDLASPAQVAEQAIISQQPVDEHAIQQRGGEYAQAFLDAFRQLSADYQRMFNQGKADALNGSHRSVTGELAQTAYQNGWQQGRQEYDAYHRSETPAPTSQVAPAGVSSGNTGVPETTTTADQETYQAVVPSNTQRAFINRLAKNAQQVAQEYDLYPSVIIAQAALESNWGNSRLGRAPFHNLFGVKGYFAGQTTRQLTNEYQGDHRLQIVDNFRRYQSDYAALQDYAQTLQQPMYQGVHRQYAANYRAATHALQGRYATDPHYEQKLNQVIVGYRLTRYDHLPRKTTSGHRPPVKVTTTSLTSREPSKPAAPVKQVKEKRHFSPLASIAGGVGSAGLVELLRRIVLK